MHDVSAWMWYAIAVGGFVLLAVLIAVAGRYIYLRQMRRSLRDLVGRREAVRAAERGLTRVIEHLLEAGDEALAAFAAHPANDDRRALEDVAGRMRVTAEELRRLTTPKRLWATADLMQHAAEVVAEEAGRVGEATTPDSVLDALASIRLEPIRQSLVEVDEAFDPVLEQFHVENPAVYGGGLYI